MNNIIEKIKNNKNLKLIGQLLFSIIVLLGISIIFSYPLLGDKYFETHDGPFHVGRIVGTAFSLSDGQKYPVIVNQWANGFGYSWNLFYPSLIIWIGVLIKPFFVTYTKTLYIIVFCLTIISAISMYKLIKEITENKKISLISALIYITLPYRLTDIFVRMALGEIITFAFFPIIFLGLYNLLYKDGKKDYYITIGSVVILLSHNISSLIVFFVSAIFLLFNIRRLFNKKVLMKLIINAIFIITITSFFFLPLIESKISCNYAVFEKDFMMDMEEFANQSVHLKQLFIDKFEYGRSYGIKDVENDVKNEMNFSLGYPLIIIISFSPLLVIKKEYDNEKKKCYLYFLCMGLVCVFMTTFYFPWKIMPQFISFIQVPFRFLLPGTFLLTVAAGMILDEEFKNIKYYHVGVFIILIFIYIYPYFQNIRYDEWYSEYPILTEKISFLACSNFEYLPQNARKDFDYVINRQKNAIIKGDAIIEKEEKNGTDYTLIIKDNRSEKLQIELPYIYYIGYKAYLNDEEIELAESEHGFLNIILKDMATGKIQVKYVGTNSMRTTLLISKISVIILIIYILNNYKDYLVKMKFCLFRIKGEENEK